MSLLPAFAGAIAGQVPHMLGLGLIWSAVTAAWHLVFVCLASRGRILFAGPRAERVLNFVSAVVLVGIGGAVAIGL